MEALILTLFVSLVLAGFGVLLFVHGVRQRSHEHTDRLALLPLEDDGQTGPTPPTTPETSPTDGDSSNA